MQRYFLPEQTATDTPLVLPATVAHHLVTVLRAQVGTAVEVVLADHQAYQAEVVALTPATITLTAPLTSQVELPVTVTLACGLPKTKEKPELIVQKGTELGAHHFIFFESERSVSHWDAKKVAKKLDRLQKIALGAAEQSHRTWLPTVEYRPNLAAVLQEPADQRLVAWEESAKQGEAAALTQSLTSLQASQRILALFGPEGGLTSAEVAAMTAAGFQAVGLGPRILRTETAPLYFLAATSYQLELQGNL